MLIFSRTLFLQIFVFLALLGLPASKLSARASRSEQGRDHYTKREKLKKKAQQQEHLDIAFVLKKLYYYYKELVVIGILLTLLSYFLFSGETTSVGSKARKNRGGAYKTSQSVLPHGGRKLILDKDPSEVKYKISDEEFAKIRERVWSRFTENKLNKAPNFYGYPRMAEELVKILVRFEECKKTKNWDEMYHTHYDWLVFPNPHNSQSMGTKTLVYEDDVAYLKNYTYKGKNKKYFGEKYVDLQRKATELVLESMGWWDSNNKKITGKCYRVHRPIRVGKMLYGSIIWNKELYEVGNALVLELEKEGHPVNLKSVNCQQYVTRNVT